jgi:hypothetical protein
MPFHVGSTTLAPPHCVCSRVATRSCPIGGRVWHPSLTAQTTVSRHAPTNQRVPLASPLPVLRSPRVTYRLLLPPTVSLIGLAAASSSPSFRQLLKDNSHRPPGSVFKAPPRSSYSTCLDCSEHARHWRSPRR